MAYTVKQLANLSGASIRTLHWYDKKELLKPSYYGVNGYRYYEEEQLLILQQILFFKELGFALKDIKKLLTQDDFDKIKSLQMHKQVLLKQIDRKKNLVITINKTILHLKGKETMKDQELYYGFDIHKQKEYEKYLVKAYGAKAETLLKQSHKKTAKWDKDEWDEVKNAGESIYKELAKAINSDLAPESAEVQKIIHRHYNLQSRFYELTREVYVGLAGLYAEHPDFKKFFDAYHLKMIPYIQEAIKCYAQRNL